MTDPIATYRGLALLVACLAAALIGGCTHGKEAQLAKCQPDAGHATVAVPGQKISDEPLSAVSHCMTANGYQLDLMDERCSAYVPVRENPSCWQFSTWFPRQTDRF